MDPDPSWQTHPAWGTLGAFLTFLKHVLCNLFSHWAHSTGLVCLFIGFLHIAQSKDPEDKPVLASWEERLSTAKL